MKKIKLTKGKYAVVDNEDFEYLNKWRWKFHKGNYAVRNSYGGKPIYMHRIVNNTKEGLLTDHINRNGLDNRKENLRTVNHSQNALNTGMWKHNTSGVKGVFWDNQKNKWHANIMINKKVKHIGFYDNINDAEKARINFEKTNYAI